jgi:hypothetical protein
MNNITRTGWTVSSLALLLNVSTALAVEAPGRAYVADRWYEDATSEVTTAPPPELSTAHVADRWYLEATSPTTTAPATAPFRINVADRWYLDPEDSR